MEASFAGASQFVAWCRATKDLDDFAETVAGIALTAWLERLRAALGEDDAHGARKRELVDAEIARRGAGV